MADAAILNLLFFFYLLPKGTEDIIGLTDHGMVCVGVGGWVVVGAGYV